MLDADPACVDLASVAWQSLNFPLVLIHSSRPETYVSHELEISLSYPLVYYCFISPRYLLVTVLVGFLRRGSIHTSQPKSCSGEVSVSVSGDLGSSRRPCHYIVALRRGFCGRGSRLLDLGRLPSTWSQGVVRSPMGKKGVVVATIILAMLTVIFGVIGAILLGLRRYQDEHDDRSVCTYQRSPATACGVVAAVLALTTQILASVAIGCCGAWQSPKRANRIAAIVFYVISWILAIIAVLVFLGGSLLIGIAGYMQKSIGNSSCVGGVRGEGVFVDATFLFLVVVALEVSSYLLIQKDDHPQAAAGGNPPLVPTATSPSAPTVTSKEDAYASAPAPANQV